jgi:hypothetical protein
MRVQFATLVWIASGLPDRPDRPRARRRPRFAGRAHIDDEGRRRARLREDARIMIVLVLVVVLGRPGRAQIDDEHEARPRFGGFAGFPSLIPA